MNWWDDESDELDDDDPLAFPVSGRTLLALVLLAIIDAHPIKGDRADANSRAKNREKRLGDALQALVGRKQKRGNKSVHDLRALIWMYECYERELSILLKAKRKEINNQSKEKLAALWFSIEREPIDGLPPEK